MYISWCGSESFPRPPVPYLLSDSRVRRIIVPTTCCTRQAPRAGDLLLHRSFSSIYLHGDKKISQRHSPSGQTQSGEETNEEQMKRSEGRKHNKKPFRSLVRQNIRWQHWALVKLASCLLRFYIQSVQSALNAMNNQICEKRARRRRGTEGKRESVVRLDDDNTQRSAFALKSRFSALWRHLMTRCYWEISG